MSDKCIIIVDWSSTPLCTLTPAQSHAVTAECNTLARIVAVAALPKGVKGH